jgi:uncharacterized protein (UPF0332 family)
VQPLDLLDVAESLIAGRSRPKDANLRRAHSSVYYALFHTLAKDCADLFLGGYGAARGQRAWKQTYRALDHGRAKKACIHGKIKDFPDSIRDFANIFAQMQDKRHGADYDPLAKLTKSEVQADILLARLTIQDYRATQAMDRRAFCAWVLFQDRKR